MTVSFSFIYTGVNFSTQPPKLHENYGRQSIYKQFLPALPFPHPPSWHRCPTRQGQDWDLATGLYLPEAAPHVSVSPQGRKSPSDPGDGGARAAPTWRSPKLLPPLLHPPPRCSPSTAEVSKLVPGQCEAAPAASITSRRGDTFPRLGDTFPGLGDTPGQGCTLWCWAPGAESVPRALLQHQLLGDTGGHPTCHTRAVLNTRRRCGFFCIIKPCRCRNCPLSHDNSFWNSAP